MDGLNVSQDVIDAYSSDLNTKAEALSEGSFTEYPANTIQVNSKIHIQIQETQNIQSSF